MRPSNGPNHWGAYPVTRCMTIPAVASQSAPGANAPSMPRIPGAIRSASSNRELFTQAENATHRRIGHALTVTTDMITAVEGIVCGRLASASLDAHPEASADDSIVQ